MIWQNPWAWAGLLSIALPIAIHMFARRSARVHPFPSLRFLDATRLTPARRTRITDIPLLLLRIAILAVAVAALAQPLLSLDSRDQRLARTLARVVIVDTSASMLRETPQGGSALDSARRAGERAGAEAQAALTIETANVAQQLDGAAAWLHAQPGRREVMIISDFQAGTLDSASIHRVPAEPGIALKRIPVRESVAPLEATARIPDRAVIASVSLDSTRSTVEWRTESAPATQPGIVVLASPEQQALANATLAAVLSVVPMPAVSRPIAVIFDSYAEREALAGSAHGLQEPWMGDVAAHVLQDSIVSRAAAGVHNGSEHLLLFVSAPPGTTSAARVIAAALESTPSHVEELDPAFVPQHDIDGWMRAPGETAPGTDGESDGRWLWLLALLLLGAETLARRSRRVAPVENAAEVTLEHVA